MLDEDVQALLGLPARAAAICQVSATRVTRTLRIDQNDAGAVHALVLVDAEELAGVVQLRVTCTSAALELVAAAAGPSSERGERRE